MNKLRPFWIAAILMPIVVFTGLRIEYLNSQNDNFLPRKERGKFRVAAPRLLKLRVRNEIRNMRLNQFAAENPGSPFPGDAEIMQAPFSKEEEVLMNSRLEKNRFRKELYGMLVTFGLLQYLFAPTVAIMSLQVMLQDKTTRSRFLLCGVFLVVSIQFIFLMFYRGYFTGWGVLD